jgi:serine/threonine protein kinase
MYIHIYIYLYIYVNIYTYIYIYIHMYIYRLFGTFKDERKLYMLLEFVQGGELFAVIHTGIQS